MGSLSFTSFVGKVAAEPEGEAITTVVDTDGEPEKVKIVSEERKRRIDSISNIDPNYFKEKYREILGIRTKSFPDSIGIEITIKEGVQTDNNETDMANEFENLEVDFRYVEQMRGELETVDVVGGDTIDSALGTPGTLNSVSLHENSDYDLTAVGPAHMFEWVDDPTEPSPGADLYNSNDELIGHVKEYFPEYDSFAAELTVDAFDYTPDPYETDSQIENIKGFWTIAGITDELDTNGNLPVEMVGHTSGYETTDVDRYWPFWDDDGDADYGTHAVLQMATNPTDYGDSGAPWMEMNEPYLVGGHSGSMNDENTTDYPYSRAIVGFDYYYEVDAITTGGTK